MPRGCASTIATRTRWEAGSGSGSRAPGGSIRGTLIAPRLRVAWAHEWLDTDDDLSVAFPDTSFGAFEVSSRSLSRDSVLARIGVQALLGDDIVVEAAYGVDVGRSETMSQQLGISLRAAF